ncbi:MAG: D-alanyl-D-alanine carboxypeptidase/D-alanyl-D-alanine-endopeptidase [Actinomycetes bacterium]
MRLALPARSALALAICTAVTFSGGPASPAAAAVTDPALAKKVASVMRDGRVQRADSGTVVLDAATGSELYGRNAARALTPASNTKVLTAVAAMHTLGPAYRFRTEVIRRGAVSGGVLAGRLYLKGYGDPTSMVSDYRALARSVRAAGIRRIDGTLAVDGSFFDSQRYNPAWRTSYASAYYAAQISALTVAPTTDYDSGTIVLTYRPGSRGSKAKISVSPAAAAAYVTINNRSTTSARGTSSTIRAQRAWGTNTITVTGRVAVGRAGSSQWITVDKPELYAGAVFRAELAKAGVTVRGSTKIIRTPAGGRVVVATDRSMTLSALLVPFLKLSNNMHAETLTKTMGTRAGRAGNWADGLAATRAYLRSLGAPTAGLALADGSGLTRANRVSARTLAGTLQRVQSRSWWPAFHAALPVAGVRDRMTGGTLRHRMNGTRAAGNAHAKTGTLTGVTSLSGYVRGRDGRRYVFAMISEHGGSSPRPVENTLVVTLANHRR